MSRTLQPCGTIAAYQRHIQRGEKACDACKVASADYAARYRRSLNGAAISRWSNKVANETARRLRHAHPDEYRQLLRDVRADMAQEPGSPIRRTTKGSS